MATASFEYKMPADVNLPWRGFKGGLWQKEISVRDFPQFGNNDNRVDQLASWIVSTFMKKLRKYPTYRNALHT